MYGKLTVLFIISFSFSGAVVAQQTTALKLQMRNFKNEVVTDNISLKVDDKQPTSKFGDNIYEFKIPSEKNAVKIEITESDYKIFYPLNNKLLVPKDVTGVIEIIVGTDKDFGTLVSIYPLIKKLQADKVTSDSYCKTATRLMEEIKLLKEDSIIRQIKKDSVFNQLSPILNRYVNAAFDLKKFVHGFDTIFLNNPKAVAMLDTQIVIYSNAWKNFYFRKDEFSNAIARYFNDDAEMQTRLTGIFRDVERIHKIYYYAQFNDLREEFINTGLITDAKVRKIKYSEVLQKFRSFSDNSVLSEELSLLEKNISELEN